MKQPSQEELLGYVLGALDAQEQRNVQQLIDQNPDIEEQLLEIRSSLLPLDCLDTSGPRPGMARRTCESVANCQSNPDEVDCSAVEFSTTLLPGHGKDVEPKLANPKTNERSLLHPSSWSVPDFVMAVGLMAIVAGILFPTISYTRFNSRVWACQNNMRELGTAFMQYSETHCGYFPEIRSDDGNLSTNGCYAAMLKDAGLVNDDKRFACAGIGADAPPVFIPRLETIKTASGKQLGYLRRSMGHYGYSMGYCDEHGNYCPPQNQGRTNVVLLADMPSLNAAGRISANHGRWGQNCLFEDGHVSFVRGESIGGDAIFVNDYNLVAPGCRPGDNVISPGHLSPAIRDMISIDSL